MQKPRMTLGAATVSGTEFCSPSPVSLVPGKPQTRRQLLVFGGANIDTQSHP